MTFPKQTLAEAVCEKLQKALLAQRWRSSLPGIRILCEEIQVSRQTMMLALRLLENAGFVKPAVHGKPRCINQNKILDAQSDSKNKSAPVIALIAWQPETDLSTTDFNLCHHLRKMAELHGFTYRHIVSRHITRAMGAKKIDQLIKRNPADVYVVMSAHPHCSRALRKLDIPVIYIGGERVKGCEPRISYSLNQMCELTIERLISMGHTKISVMLPEGINLASQQARAGEKMVEQIFQSYNLPFSTYNCPRWGKTKSDFYKALEQLFSLTPPTSLVLGDVTQFHRVSSFLIRRKLNYPDDVSLIVLDEGHALQEYQPQISYLKGNHLLFAKMVMKSIRKKLAKQTDQELIIAPSQLVITDSVKRQETAKPNIEHDKEAF